MSRRNSLLGFMGRALSQQLDRLRRTLDNLSQRLRAAVTQAVGEMVGAAVCQTLHAALGDDPAYEEEFDRPYVSRCHDPPAWANRAERGERSWEQSPWNDYPDWQDAEDALPTSYPESKPEPVPEVESHPSTFARLLLVGCQAAAWWLRRHSGRRPLLAALGVGAACAVATYLGGPVLLTGAGLAGSALGLMTLAQAARSGARALAGRDVLD